LQKYENALYLIPLIANAVGATREDKARNAVARLLKVAPNFQVSRMGEFIRRRSSLEALAKTLREAGLPE
jgi:hypothetical protein